MIKVFFSYSHRDSSLRDELEVHLSPLKRDRIISTWHDRDIDAGSDFSGTISENLEDSDVILLLVSPYFLASDYCHDVEMKRALERESAGEARVIPVILESCDWHHSPFGHLLAMPTDGKPVTKHENFHDALLQVAVALRELAERGSADPVTETPVETISTISPSEPRSSNLRVAKELSDRERDRFRTEAFEYMSKFFENSLAELERRNDGLDTTFRRVDANAFTCAVYVNGSKESACSIVLDGAMGEIAFSSGEEVSRNSCNEWLSVEHDGYVTSLMPGGMAFRGGENRPLTMQGASEYFWQILVETLQCSR